MPAILRHFAITAEDTGRARAFYEAVMGWRFSPWVQPDVLLLEGAGVSGLIHTPATVSGKPLLGMEPTFAVDDLEATAAAVGGQGAAILQPPYRLDGVGTMIRFEDPAGSMLVAMRYERGMPALAEVEGAARVRHFAINADDVARSKRFYEDVFGWTFTPWGPPGFYQTRSAGSGFMGALQERRSIGGKVMPGIELSFGVGDVGATANLVAAHGGRVLMPPFRIEGVGELIFFEDSEGNIAGAMQYDEGTWE